MASMRLINAAAVLMLAACASGPGISTEGVNETVTPRQATAEIQDLRGDEVLWGGTIVSSTNLENSTRLEVLAYPLDSAQLPETFANPTGRFLVAKQGYLETVDYSPGRLVTVKGTLTKTHEGQIGETEYTYPVVAADQLYLWPKEGVAEWRGPGLNLGIGVGVLF
jgi:outer membrane lipoprotein